MASHWFTSLFSPEITTARRPAEDPVVRADLRAKEIAMGQWWIVTDAEGNSGRRAALAGKPPPEERIIHSKRDMGTSPGAVQVWFHRLYGELGLKGASSHSGRRTFITKSARIVEAGGSSRDVQELAGHASLSTTQRYIEGSTDANGAW